MTIDARHHVLQWMYGASATHVLATVVELGLVEAMTEHGGVAADLAAELGLAPQPLTRLLRTMSSMDLCREIGPGVFALTDTGALLSQRHPDSLRDTVRLMTTTTTRQSWARLDHSIRTGQAAFSAANGRSIFDHLAGDPDLSRLYNAFMAGRSRGISRAVSARYDFGRLASAVDVGGGDGTLLTTILADHPELRGTVFDNHQGAARAMETIRDAGLADRCVVTHGDFFAAIPAGSDLYLLKWILHDWDDDRAAAILDRCRAALPGNGRVLLIEYVLPDSATLAQRLDDLNMLVIYGGQRRIHADFEKLCARSGLTLTRTIPIPEYPGLCLLEASAGSG